MHHSPFNTSCPSAETFREVVTPLLLIKEPVSTVASVPDRDHLVAGLSKPPTAGANSCLIMATALNCAVGPVRRRQCAGCKSPRPAHRDPAERMGPPHRQSMFAISPELRIYIITLYKWRKAWYLQGDVVPAS
jgi:hypothetical protein